MSHYSSYLEEIETRKEQGLPFMGAPTISELDTWNYAGRHSSKARPAQDELTDDGSGR